MSTCTLLKSIPFEKHQCLLFPVFFIKLRPMFNLPYQPIRRLRLWLVAAAAILLITSVLEAGHAHGVVLEADEHCTLCQHSVALDKFLSNDTQFVIFLLLALFTFTFYIHYLDSRCTCFAPIRAPPVVLHRC
ncbi:MAG: hypothetical protein V4732_01680 [Pseudomonadota bacterium]